MAILSSLKALLGLTGDSPPPTESNQLTDVAPAVERERAVKAPVSELKGQAATKATESAGGNRQPVDSITGIGPTYRERLAEAGITSVEELAGAEAATVAAACDVSQARVVKWMERAKDR